MIDEKFYEGSKNHYPMDSAIHLSNNWPLVLVAVTTAKAVKISVTTNNQLHSVG